MRHAALGILLAVAAVGALAADGSHRDPLLERGRYIVRTSGCNDCHTPGYPESGGAVPEAKWLTGDVVGWSGPWGTTYAANLRLYFASLTEEQWMKRARSLPARPPMPWFSLRDMSDRDLRALYRYARHLGPAGSPAPAYLAPDLAPSQPYIQFPKGAQ